MNWTLKLIALLSAAGQTQVLAKRNFNRFDQAVLGEVPWKASDSQKLAPTMTVNVQGTASATFEPDRASIRIEVSAKNETEHSARAAWKTAAELVAEIIDSTSSVTEWRQSPSRTYDSSQSWPRSFDDSDDHSPTVANHFTAQLNALDMVDSLMKKVAGIEHVAARWAYWDLSEENKTSAVMSTNKASIKHCLDAGQRYADTLGYSTMELVGLDEQYNYLDSMEDESREKVTRTDEDPEEFKPQKVVAFTEVKCSIRLF